jgi:hypothetical protein
VRRVGGGRVRHRNAGLRRGLSTARASRRGHSYPCAAPARTVLTRGRDLPCPHRGARLGL